MKRLLIALIFVLAIGLDLQAKPAPVSLNVSFGVFYNSLRPYGEWIEIDADIFAWRPHSIGRHWRPYSEGRWSWTSYGWYWDSFEPYGWATYHYGRWYYDDYYGWIWLPDYEWGPSWVEWRYDDDYIGWAPLPPYAQFRANSGIYFSINWHSHYDYWNFVSVRRFCDYRVAHYLVDYRHNKMIFERTKYRNNYFMDRDRIVNGGVDRSFIERKSGYRITQRDIRETNDFGNYERTRGSRGNELYAYKPSERDINSSRNIDRAEIKRGENRSSLDRDKITINRRNDDFIKREPNDNVGRNNEFKRDERVFQNQNENRDAVKDRNENRDQTFERKSIDKGNTRSNDNIFQRKENSERKREPQMSRERSINREQSSPKASERRVERNNKSESRSSESRSSERRRR